VLALGKRRLTLNGSVCPDDYAFGSLANAPAKASASRPSSHTPDWRCGGDGLDDFILHWLANVFGLFVKRCQKVFVMLFEDFDYALEIAELNLCLAYAHNHLAVFINST
jgi:hypothetical protein